MRETFLCRFSVSLQSSAWVLQIASGGAKEHIWCYILADKLWNIEHDPAFWMCSLLIHQVGIQWHLYQCIQEVMSCKGCIWPFLVIPNIDTALSMCWHMLYMPYYTYTIYNAIKIPFLGDVTKTQTGWVTHQGHTNLMLWFCFKVRLKNCLCRCGSSWSFSKWEQ